MEINGFLHQLQQALQLWDSLGIHPPAGLQGYEPASLQVALSPSSLRHQIKTSATPLLPPLESAYSQMSPAMAWRHRERRFAVFHAELLQSLFLLFPY